MGVTRLDQLRQRVASIPLVSAQDIVTTLPDGYEGLVVARNLGVHAMSLVGRLQPGVGKLLLIEDHAESLVTVRRRMIHAYMDEACGYSLWSEETPGLVSERVNRWRSHDALGYVFVGLMPGGISIGKLLERMPGIVPSTRVFMVRGDDDRHQHHERPQCSGPAPSDPSLVAQRIQQVFKGVFLS